MPKARVREEIPASAAAVFALLHDYDHRLEWDTLLQAAYLTDGHAAAKLGAVTVCRGRASLGGIALKTRYISFRPGEVAAVKMINRPPFFERFAATIRHRDLGNGYSSVEYHYNFTARPRWLRFLLHPLVNILFRLETKKRLRALRKHFRQRTLNKEQFSTATVGRMFPNSCGASLTAPTGAAGMTPSSTSPNSIEKSHEANCVKMSLRGEPRPRSGMIAGPLLY